VTVPGVLVVADDPLSRGGVAALLGGQRLVRVVGQGPVDEAAALVGAERPDVLCWDPGPGVPPTAELVGAAGAAPVLALTSAGTTGGSLLAAGVRALLDRGAEAETLAAALLATARGLSVLSPAQVAAWLRPQRGAPEADGLTPREREVLALLVEGLGNKAIAARLGISDHTAKFHVNAILGKLGAGSRAEAIVVAARRGLVAL
jgi:DNA-binding NarL/FixJ family response regulator